MAYASEKIVKDRAQVLVKMANKMSDDVLAASWAELVFYRDGMDKLLGHALVLSFDDGSREQAKVSVQAVLERAVKLKKMIAVITASFCLWSTLPRGSNRSRGIEDFLVHSKDDVPGPLLALLKQVKEGGKQFMSA